MQCHGALLPKVWDAKHVLRSSSIFKNQPLTQDLMTMNESDRVKGVKGVKTAAKERIKLTKPEPAKPKKPTKRPKVAEMVAAELRHQIVTGRLKPGDKLHPESVLQTEFNISRPTLREALRLLESESLISITRGKYGGSRVTSVDLGAAARQVGVFLQIEGATLEDVWLARTIIEPPAAGLMAAQKNATALAALEANIAAAQEVAQSNPIRYADLSAQFSILITQNCGNKTIQLLSALIYDIIRKQHEHITERTLAKAGVDKLRQDSIRSRIEVVELMRHNTPAAVETFWRAHLLHMRDLVMSAYKIPMTIEVLNGPVGRLRPVGNVKRADL